MQNPEIKDEIEDKIKKELDFSTEKSKGKSIKHKNNKKNI